MSLFKRRAFDDVHDRALPDVFTAVKQSVTARQVAEMYGIEVKHNGMACCPFHDDKTPSMKLDERYYCFGCHASGDAIDFVSTLFQIGTREAALQIAEDFHIAYSQKKRPQHRCPTAPEEKKELETRQLLNDFRVWRGKVLSDLNGDYRILTERAERHTPTDREAPFPKAFIETHNDLSLVEFYIGLLETAPQETQISIFIHERITIAALDDRVNERKKGRSSIREKLEEKKVFLSAQRLNKQSTSQQKQQAAI